MGLDNFVGGVAGGATVAIVIKAVDQYSGEMAKASQGLEKLEGDLKKQNDVIKKSNAALTIYGAAAVAAGTAVYSLAVEAGKAENIGRAFTKMYGEEAPGALRILKSATQGAVSDVKLMTAANQALLLGIDENALPKMFEGAYAVSQATGRPVADAINDISLGIARQSKLILDNLGIIVDVERANKNYATSIGKTANQLTEAERKIAFTNAAMEALAVNTAKVGQVTDNAAIKAQQLSASWDNVRISIGKALEPLVNNAEGALSGVLNVLTGANPEFDKMMANKAKWESYWKDRASTAAEKEKSQQQQTQINLDQKNSMLRIANDILQGTSLEQQTYNAKVEELNQKLANNNITYLEYVNAINAANKALEKQVTIYDKLRASSSYLRGKSDSQIDLISSGFSSNAISTDGGQTYHANPNNSGSPRGITLNSSKSLNDGIISPRGDIISTHPDDYIIATKNPGSLAGGGRTVIININGPIQGLNPQAVGAAIQAKLGRLVST